MDRTLFLASSNPGKLRELRALAEGSEINVELLPKFRELPAAREDHARFALNALEKTLHYSRVTDQLVVADDSGLVVDALDGAPGVRSARYAGLNSSDKDNNRKLLSELSSVPEEKRTARYLCVLALARQNRLLALFSDSCEGLILTEHRGRGGFGYDPLFYFPPLGKTLAELSEAEKNLHSHRGKAFRKLLSYLKEHNL